MKKPSLTSFLITLLLAAAICTHGQEAVRDTKGNPVEVGKKYFIKPVKTRRITGGGLVPDDNRMGLCPRRISQTFISSYPGVPVSFGYPNITGRDTIDTSTDINIQFIRSEEWPLCEEYSNLWAVYDSSSAAWRHPLIIGGNRESPDSAFKIEKYTEELNKKKIKEDTEAETYKLTTSYGIVGTNRGGSIFSPRPLFVTQDEEDTLLVQFVKVDDDATTAITTTTTSRVEKLGLRMFPFY